MSPAFDWVLWQLADSAFPAGGFAHSGGVEAAWQLGELSSVSRFAAESLEQAGAASVPLVLAAHDAPEQLCGWDSLADASLPNHVANRASRTQGAAFLATAAASFQRAALSTLRAEALRAGWPLHFAPVFGLVARTLEVERRQAARLFLFLSLRSMLSAAVRLGALGPREAQLLQHRLRDVAEEVLEQSVHLVPDQLAQTSPLLDLFQGHHDRLYSRLFSS